MMSRMQARVLVVAGIHQRKVVSHLDHEPFREAYQTFCVQVELGAVSKGGGRGCVMAQAADGEGLFHAGEGCYMYTFHGHHIRCSR